MNDPSRARDVQSLIVEHKVGVVGLLETKVKHDNIGIVVNRVNGNWKRLNNYSSDESGRVFVGWDPMKYSIRKISESKQAIHTEVTARNDASERNSL